MRVMVNDDEFVFNKKSFVDHLLKVAVEHLRIARGPSTRSHARETPQHADAVFKIPPAIVRRRKQGRPRQYR